MDSLGGSGWVSGWMGGLGDGWVVGVWVESVAGDMMQHTYMEEEEDGLRSMHPSSLFSSLLFETGFKGVWGLGSLFDAITL
jgi:hypothetical protein